MGRDPESADKNSKRPFETELNILRKRTSKQITDEKVDKVMSRVEKSNVKANRLTNLNKKKDKIQIEVDTKVKVEVEDRRAENNAAISKAIDDMRDYAIRTDKARKDSAKIQNALDEIRAASESNKKTAQANLTVQDAINSLASGGSEIADPIETSSEPLVNNSATNIGQNLNAKASIPVAQDQIRNIDAALPTSNDVVKPKKKKIWLKVLLGLLVVLILGCAGTWAWFNFIYNSPAKALTDAIKNYSDAEEVSLSGSFMYGDTTDGSQRIVGSYQLASTQLPTRIDLEASMFYVGDEDSTDLEINGIVVADGTIYLRLDRIGELLTSEESSNIFTELLENIKNKWWRISQSDIAELEQGSRDIFSTISSLFIDSSSEIEEEEVATIEEEIDAIEEELVKDDLFASEAELITPLADFYGCLVTASKNDQSGIIGEIYAKYPFITAKKTQESTFSINVYELSMDNSIAEKFMQEYNNTAGVRSVQACVDEYLAKTGDGDDIEYSSSLSTIPDNKVITVAIDNFRHELRHLYVNDKNDIMQTFEVRFDYTAKNVSAPTSSSSISEFMEILGEFIVSLFLSEDYVYTDEYDIEDYNTEYDYYYYYD